MFILGPRLAGSRTNCLILVHHIDVRMRRSSVSLAAGCRALHVEKLLLSFCRSRKSIRVLESGSLIAASVIDNAVP
jgi:hypothetical protein